MKIKLFESELKVMEILWQHSEMTAKDLAISLNEQVGWSKTTTYTVIKKCIDKEAVLRLENFLCRPLITKDEVRQYETMELVDKMYNGSSDLLITSLLGGKSLNSEQIANLRQLIESLE